MRDFGTVVSTFSIESLSVSADGKGKALPIADNGNKEGRAANL